MPNIYRINSSEDENRGFNNFLPSNKSNNKKKKNKKDFKTLKNNTFKSLNDVEYFLNNWGQFMKYAKFYKLFKKG